MSKVNAISVIGLGKLGLCALACFARKYKSIGIDIDRNKIDSISKGNNPIEETGLTEILNENKKNIEVTDQYREAILNSAVTFIVVATPSEADGSFSNKQLEESLRQIASALKEKNSYHLIVITSTVMPGVSEHVGKFIIEDVSGKKCGKDFGIAYNPEFIALGSVIHDFLNPDFILIGEMDKKDGDVLEEIYKNICENSPRFGRMNLVSAEIAKISLNCYITMKITYANSLATICEKVPSADAKVITQAIGLDSRIGRKYLSPGLGYGGPCFPRDNVAFAAFALKVGEKAKLSEMVDEVNKDQAQRIERIIKNIVYKIDKPKDKLIIGMLGLAYKPNTYIIEDSQAIDITELLINQGYKIMVFDPQAQGAARGVLGDAVFYANSCKECLEKVDLAVFSTAWNEFKNIDLSNIRKNMYILDCWGIFEGKNVNDNIKYIGKGEIT